MYVLSSHSYTHNIRRGRQAFPQNLWLTGRNPHTRHSVSRVLNHCNKNKRRIAQIQTVTHSKGNLFYTQPCKHGLSLTNLLNIVTVVKAKAGTFEASLRQCLHWKLLVPPPQALLWLDESIVNNCHPLRKTTASICLYLLYNQWSNNLLRRNTQTASCAKTWHIACLTKKKKYGWHGILLLCYFFDFEWYANDSWFTKEAINSQLKCLGR